MKKYKDYEYADKHGILTPLRWENGVPHHPESIRLMEFIAEHDYKDYNLTFDWNVGGDGDNGETLMYQLDAYFEARDAQKKEARE